MCCICLPTAFFYDAVFHCLPRLPSLLGICPATQHLWLAVTRQLTSHEKSQGKSQKGKTSKHVSTQCAACLAKLRRILSVTLSYSVVVFLRPLPAPPPSGSYETFYWIQSCLLSRENFISLTHELFKNYSIKCWLIAVQFFFSGEKAIHTFAFVFCPLPVPSALLVTDFIRVCGVLCNLK